MVCEGVGAGVLSGQGTVHRKAAPEYNSEIYEKLERMFAHFHKHLYLHTFILFLGLDFNRNYQNTLYHESNTTTCS